MARVDPQPRLVELLVRHVRLPRELLPHIEINSIARLKWSLWHGQVDKALGKVDDLESSIAPFSETYARFTPLRQALSELRTYIVATGT